MNDVPSPRPVHDLTVVSTERLTRTMVRVDFAGETIATFPDTAVPGADAGFTDTYVKLRFGDVVRAYTLRSVDREGGRLTIDFVVHGDHGVAGPWAAAAQPGDRISCLHPGGEWAPRPSADAHLLVGDEAAFPAIGSALEVLLAARPDATALVFAEVEQPGDEYPFATGPGVDIRWVYRDGGAYGAQLVAEVLAHGWPGGDVEGFVHGNAEMVRPVRRYLLRDIGMPRQNLSISGYWRAGHTDEAWRAVKKEFNALMEQESSGKERITSGRR